MRESKTMIRFFTIADFEEEERWLREQHRQGRKLVRTVLPCFYVFESCPPEDVIYRLDFKNGDESGDYLQMFRDYGWEYFNECAGWLYFRKRAADIESEAEGEIFSDGASRVEMVQKLTRTRMLPLLAIFLCCVPNLTRSLNESGAFATVLKVLLTLLLLLYVPYLFLLVYCGVKLARLKRKYQREP